jgi:hypothetical protein
LTTSFASREEPTEPNEIGPVMGKKIELREAAGIVHACRGLSGTEATEALDRVLKFARGVGSHGGTIDLHLKDIYLVGQREGDNVYFDEDALYDALRQMGCNNVRGIEWDVANDGLL